MKQGILFIAIEIIFTISGFSQTIDFAVSESFHSYVQWTNRIVVDNAGNCYINGVTRFWQSNAMGGYFIKYNSNGLKEWEKVLDNYRQFETMSVDRNNNIYIMVSAWNNRWINIDGSNFKEGALLKFNTNGVLQWGYQYPFGPDDCLKLYLGKKFNNENSLLITGFTSTAKTLPGNVFTQPTSTNGSYFIGKINENGEFLWAKADKGKGYNYQFNETGFYVKTANSPTKFQKYNTNAELIYEKSLLVAEIAPDEFGNLYVLEVDSSDLANNSNKNFYLEKLDANGNLYWKKSRIYCDEWYKVQMVCGNNGDLFISGGFANYMTIGDTTIYANGNSYNVFVTKLDSSGALKWIISSDGSGGAGAKDIYVKDKEIYVTGDIWGSVTFGSHTLNQIDGGVFTIKITDEDITAVSPEIKKNNSIQVFPNPSQNYFYLKILLSERDALDIKIMDVKGKLVYSEKMSEFEGELNKKIELKQAPGVYFLQVTGTINNFSQKIILHH
jgi:hypothetical protein